MNKLLLGRFFPGNSVIHRLDARGKLLGGISFIFITFLANHLLSLAFLWIFTFFIMKLSEVSFKIYFRGVRPLIWLILFTVTLQILFTAGGTIYFEWGPITISQFGLVNGFYIFSRFVMIILVTTVVTMTTKPLELTDAIYFCLKPLKIFRVPVEQISMMLSIAIRFIPNLFDETQKIMDAQKARGAVFGEGNLFQQMKALVPVFLPLFTNSLNRAEDLADAMEVRGYQPSNPRTSFRQMHWSLRDTLSMLVILMLTGILILLNSISLHFLHIL